MVEMTPEQHQRVGEILVTIRSLAAEFYRLTGKLLGVIAEVADQLVAGPLSLTLMVARTAGYDATRLDPAGVGLYEPRSRVAPTRPGRTSGNA